MNIEQLAIKNLETQVEIYRKLVSNYDRLLAFLQSECYQAHKDIIEGGHCNAERLKSLSSDIYHPTPVTNDISCQIEEGKNWIKQLQP